MRRSVKMLGVAALLAPLGSPLAADVPEDRYRWLEAPRDAKALDWAQARSKAAAAKIAAMPGRAEVLAELKTALAAQTPPPAYMLLGGRIVRFQRSTDHPHGVLAIAALGANGTPGAWRTLLDVDALRKAEGKPYELHFGQGAFECLRDRCLVSLSPAGADDVELREYDLATGRFVEGGFRTAASRAFAVWLDRDRLLIQHTVGDAPKLASGWPASVAIWTRGTPLSAAKMVYRAGARDAIVNLDAVGAGKNRVAVIQRAIDYSTFEHLVLRPDGRVEPTHLPAAVKMTLHTVGGSDLIVQLGKAATVGGHTYPAESVLAYDLRASTPAARRLSLVYRPAEGDFIADLFGGLGVGGGKVRMIVTRRGVGRIVTATRAGNGWAATAGPAEAVGTAIKIANVDSASGAAIVERQGYLEPSHLDLIGAAGKTVRLYAEAPAIDLSGYRVDLKTARSKDGTDVDYYLLRPKVLPKSGAVPTLITGYGAFGLSFTPEYFGYTVGGKALIPWLKRGGMLALPMIRGGGERGEAWHLAAIREKRQNSYDDFAAVTEALIASGATSAGHIGVFGSSNGGLLAATMGTQRPDLYGAVVSDVPLTDLIRMPLMGMGAAWTNEYGDPDDPAMRAAILKYSPYQNVVKGRAYPPFLITVATSDNRVGPGHARKLAASLEEAGATVYYLEDQEGGHGVSDPLSRPELMADRMTFLIDVLK